MSTKICGECTHPLGDHFAGCNEHYRNQLQAAEPTVDMINHPPHYKGSAAAVTCINCGERTTVECIDVTRHMNFNVGNVIKYCWRLGLKGDPVEQLKKAVFYLQDEIKRLGGAS